MDDSLTVSDLKRKLLQEVGSLFHRNGPVWKPVHEVVHDLRQSRVPAVLFGGTLRSLLVSRIFHDKPGRPRDIDIVVSGTTTAQLEERFRGIVARRTRFGGLRLERGDWQFDVWPVEETWAFKHDHGGGTADFAGLPRTTTFNLEAVAVEAWPCAGRPRSLFSGDEQFFEGIISRTIELNREKNPFPELTVVRGLILARELRFKIGPRLARYIGEVGASMNEDVIDRIQADHYGLIRMSSRALHDSITIMVRQTRYGECNQLSGARHGYSWGPRWYEESRAGHRYRATV